LIFYNRDFVAELQAKRICTNWNLKGNKLEIKEVSIFIDGTQPKNKKRTELGPIKFIEISSFIDSKKAFR